MMSRLLPLLAFLVLGALLAVGLKIAGTKTHIPSPLIGKAVPTFELPQLFNPDVSLSPLDFEGEPYLVNFWGSWCPTCVVEHPVITDLAATGKIRILGLNYRDEPDDARAWLQRHGNPYDDIIFDYEGRISIDFGVYAAPETFLVSPAGEIVFKHIGALTSEIVFEVIIPMAEKLKTGQL
jgi:cytochrome c biogenesis protein CcmG/thiol:disulfide interchange protein DsbE